MRIAYSEMVSTPTCEGGISCSTCSFEQPASARRTISARRAAALCSFDTTVVLMLNVMPRMLNRLLKKSALKDVILPATV